MSLTDQLHLHEPPALCPLPFPPSCVGCLCICMNHTNPLPSFSPHPLSLHLASLPPLPSPSLSSVLSLALSSPLLSITIAITTTTRHRESGKGAEGEGEEDEEEEVGEEDVGLETEGRERERVGVVRGVVGPHSECVECDGEGIVRREMMQRAARHEEIRSERCGVEAGGLDSREAASAGHGGLEARGAHVLRCAERTCSHAEACSATASALLGTYGNLVSVSRLESLGLVSEAQDTVEMGVNEWREETGYAAAEVVRETERVVDEGSATALTRSPPPHPPSHPHTLELLPAEPRPSMPQDLVRQQSKPGSCKVRECALPEVWWESSNIHDLCCCTSCCYSCSAACPHSCSSSCSCSCSSGGGGSSSRERVSGSSGGIEMPWAWGCVRWERRVEAMEQAKGLVRARRGGQRQPASSLPRPPAPSVLLDDLAWSVSEPPTEARMLGSLVSGGVDEVGMGEGHGSDGAAGAGGSCASVGTRMHHSQLSALLYPHAFLTLLFPLDVYSEVAPSARSYFSPAGFSSLRLLSLVYSFYQASPLGACDGAGMGWGMGWGHGLGDGVGDVMGHGIGDGMGHGIGDGMGHGLVDGIGGHGMGNGIGGDLYHSQETHRMPPSPPLLPVCVQERLTTHEVSLCCILRG
ncbi:unnamed protein product [Closterium sp. NIES-65]|nr:unnamed protein product [Closterium sp. NIES-65]